MAHDPWHDDDEPNPHNSLMDQSLLLPQPSFVVRQTPSTHALDARCLFTEDVQAFFLEQLAATGRKYMAAAQAGTTCRTVDRHRKDDPEFAARYDEAMEAYKDHVRATVQRRALEGDLVPIVGRVGKDRDGIIAYTRKFSDTLLLAEAKRVDPEYRERSSVDMNVKAAGVLVVGTMMGPADWQAAFGGQHLPTDPLAGLPGVTQDMLEKDREHD